MLLLYNRIFWNTDTKIMHEWRWQICLILDTLKLEKTVIDYFSLGLVLKGDGIK